MVQQYNENDPTAKSQVNAGLPTGRGTDGKGAGPRVNTPAGLSLQGGGGGSTGPRVNYPAGNSLPQKGEAGKTREPRVNYGPTGVVPKSQHTGLKGRGSGPVSSGSPGAVMGKVSGFSRFGGKLGK